MSQLKSRNITLPVKDKNVCVPLPKICVQCGRPADQISIKRFLIEPRGFLWIPMIGFLMVLLTPIIETKWVRAVLPVCDRHRNPWLWRDSMIAFSAMLSISPIVFTQIVPNTWFNNFHIGLVIMVVWIVWGLFGISIIIILMYLIEYRAIDAKSLTDSELKLRNVSPIFVELFKTKTQQDELNEI